MLAAAETGLDAVSSFSSDPTGSLRVSSPAFMAQTRLMETFANFVAAYPGVDVDFHFPDHRSDLIKDGFDVAIRAGWLEDSDLMSRNIGSSARFLVASPAYVDARSPITTPVDLEDWDWIRFAMRPDQTLLTGPKRPQTRCKKRHSTAGQGMGHGCSTAASRVQSASLRTAQV